MIHVKRNQQVKLVIHVKQHEIVQRHNVSRETGLTFHSMKGSPQVCNWI